MFIIIKKHRTHGQVVGAQNPAIHPTYEKAETEAKRLAELDYEFRYYVMAVAAEVEQVKFPVKVSRYNLKITADE